MKYHVSKRVCRSKQCKITIPIVESRAVQDGWRRRTKRVSGWQCDKCANVSSNLHHFTEELRKKPLSISAMTTTESLADVIKQLHNSHIQRANSQNELSQRLKDDLRFINCVQILFQLNSTATVESANGTLIQKCEGCSRKKHNVQ